MVELFINLTIVVVISFAMIVFSITALLSLKLILNYKENKNNNKPTHIQKSEPKEQTKLEEDEDEKQSDYVAKVYQLVDDVLAGKKELDMGDNDNEA